MLLLGTDFGGSKIRAGAVDADGRVVATAEVPTEARGGVAMVLENLDRAFRLAAERAGASIEDVRGIGVAAPGMVDGATGAVVHGPNLGWVDVPLGAILRDRYRVPIAVENDVNAAALGELRLGAGRDLPGCRDLALIFFGTGIGGGIVANGEVVSGATGAAGEIGHLVFRAQGPEPCSCGKTGHFEAYAGGACAERRLARLLAAGAKSRALDLAGGDPERVMLGHIFEAADSGCAVAAGIVADLEAAAAVLAANLATLLNPALLVIGGGVARRRRRLVALCARAVEALATVAAARAAKVVESVLWEDAAVLGSAELVRRRAGGGAGEDG